METPLPVLLRAARARKLVAVLRAGAYARRHPGLGPIVVHDVGGRGGLQGRWRVVARFAPVVGVLFEPDPAEAARLRASGERVTVVEWALGAEPGTATLHITREPGRSSLLVPNVDRIAPIAATEPYEVTGTAEVRVERLADLVERGEAPAPDFLKIDTQGYERRILDGLGGLLDRVVGIELEARTIEFYRGETSFEALVLGLDRHGFALVAARPNGFVADGIVEFNALFLRRRTAASSARQLELRRFYQLLQGIPSSTAAWVASS